MAGNALGIIPYPPFSRLPKMLFHLLQKKNKRTAISDGNPT